MSKHKKNTFKTEGDTCSIILLLAFMFEICVLTLRLKFESCLLKNATINCVQSLKIFKMLNQSIQLTNHNSFDFNIPNGTL
ncbi:UNVERIFIED_CONTAM: hypothetical protein NCL1_54337 [Trichonephila clavipes]